MRNIVYIIGVIGLLRLLGSCTVMLPHYGAPDLQKKYLVVDCVFDPPLLVIPGLGGPFLSPPRPPQRVYAWECARDGGYYQTPDLCWTPQVWKPWADESKKEKYKEIYTKANYYLAEAETARDGDKRIGVKTNSEKQEQNPLRLYENAAENGDLSSAYILSKLYRQGTFEVTKNLLKATYYENLVEALLGSRQAPHSQAQYSKDMDAYLADKLVQYITELPSYKHSSSSIYPQEVPFRYGRNKSLKIAGLTSDVTLELEHKKNQAEHTRQTCGDGPLPKPVGSEPRLTQVDTPRKFFALLIAEQDYDSPEWISKYSKNDNLKTAIYDLETLKDVLVKRYCFEQPLLVKGNITGEEFDHQLSVFSEQIAQSDSPASALIVYAGYASNPNKHPGFWIPRDFPYFQDDDMEFPYNLLKKDASRLKAYYRNPQFAYEIAKLNAHQVLVITDSFFGKIAPDEQAPRDFRLSGLHVRKALVSGVTNPLHNKNDSKVEHSIFLGHLISALSSMRNEGGEISGYELFKAIQPDVIKDYQKIKGELLDSPVYGDILQAKPEPGDFVMYARKVID